MAVDFYVRVLRFTVERDERDEGYVALRRDAVLVGAARREPEDAAVRRPPAGVELVLEVDDLDVETDHVRAQGWPLEEPMTERPWGLRDVRLLDPDGYYWRLTTH